MSSSNAEFFSIFVAFSAVKISCFALLCLFHVSGVATNCSHLAQIFGAESREMSLLSPIRNPN